MSGIADVAIIEIASQGGFGGIAAAALHKRIELDRQDALLRAALCAAFQPDALSRMAALPCPDCPDRLSYLITVTDEARRRHSFTLSEAQMPPEMLDLIDEV